VGRFLVSLLVVFQLLSGVAYAFPSVAELQRNRVQLERLRRYVIFQFAQNPQGHTQESVNMVLQVVTSLDVQIVRLVFLEVHHDDMVAEEALANEGASK